MGKRALSKRELEEMKKKEEDEAAAHVCSSFASSSLWKSDIVLKPKYLYRLFKNL